MRFHGLTRGVIRVSFTLVFIDGAPTGRPPDEPNRILTRPRRLTHDHQDVRRGVFHFLAWL